MVVFDPNKSHSTILDDGDSWIPRLPCIAHGRAVVGRTVVDQDDFKIDVYLVYDGIKAFIQVFLDIIDGDDDGNRRFHQLKAKSEFN